MDTAHPAAAGCSPTNPYPTTSRWVYIWLRLAHQNWSYRWVELTANDKLNKFHFHFKRRGPPVGKRCIRQQKPKKYYNGYESERSKARSITHMRVGSGGAGWLPTIVIPLALMPLNRIVAVRKHSLPPRDLKPSY
jgi:hypothetical protein